jgi:hypothetical protein
MDEFLAGSSKKFDQSSNFLTKMFTNGSSRWLPVDILTDFSTLVGVVVVVRTPSTTNSGWWLLLANFRTQSTILQCMYHTTNVFLPS